MTDSERILEEILEEQERFFLSRQKRLKRDVHQLKEEINKMYYARRERIQELFKKLDSALQEETLS